MTTGQKPIADGFPVSPHSRIFFHPPHQGPRPYEAILLDRPEQNTVLVRCGLPRSPVDLTGTIVPVAACLRRIQWM